MVPDQLRVTLNVVQLQPWIVAKVSILFTSEASEDSVKSSEKALEVEKLGALVGWFEEDPETTR